MFCTRCGNQLAPGTGFCGACGLKLTPDAPAPAPGGPVPGGSMTSGPGPVPPLYAPPGAQPQGTSWVKVLLIVLGGLFLLGAIGVAGVVWAGFWAKNKIEQKAKESGIDLEKMGEQLPAAKRVDPCTLLTKDEAQKILGVTIDRVEASNERTCFYFTDAKSDETEKTPDKALEEKIRKAGKDPVAVEQATRAILGDMFGGEGAYLGVSVQWEEGRASLTTFQIALELLGPELKTRLSGLGDQAFMGPMDSMLLFRKGATGVVIDLRMVPNARAKGIEIARKIESRLDI